jgi:hypothetical protein
MKCPTVEAVAVLVAQGDKILMVFNPRWGAFTFPMSKRKEFRDPTVSQAGRPEDWSRAGARVAAEVLGRSFAPGEFPKLLCEIKEFEQSDVDGVWKLYSIGVFGLEAPAHCQVASGITAEWLRPSDFQGREPITHTARFIISRLAETGALPPWKT